MRRHQMSKLRATSTWQSWALHIDRVSKQKKCYTKNTHRVAIYLQAKATFSPISPPPNLEHVSWRTRSNGCGWCGAVVCCLWSEVLWLPLRCLYMRGMQEFLQKNNPSGPQGEIRVHQLWWPVYSWYEYSSSLSVLSLQEVPWGRDGGRRYHFRNILIAWVWPSCRIYRNSLEHSCCISSVLDRLMLFSSTRFLQYWRLYWGNFSCFSFSIISCTMSLISGPVINFLGPV